MPVTDWPLGEGADTLLLLAATYAFPPDAQNIGVAVSGGGDSIALLHLMHRAAPHKGYRLSAVTVDHRLRPESAAEAEGVARFCAGLGIPHDILVWDHGGEVTGNLMDQARRARRSLMADWARVRGVTHIALGHTADDQAETFLMGLARSAGLDGLSGMRQFWDDAGLWWGRPLLDQRREALRAYLRRQGIDWVDDPTNEDDSFARIKARRALAALAPLGITVDALCASASNLSWARHALVDATGQVAGQMQGDAGQLSLGRDAFSDQPQDIRRRLLIAALRWMNGADYAPRAMKLSHLDGSLREGRDGTLAGVRFRHKAGTILILREPRAAQGPVPLGQRWDHRWQVTGPDLPGATVAALGAEGLRNITDWRALGLPRDALLVTPAIWRDGRLIAAPLAGFPGDWRAFCAPTFTSFILSH